MQQGQQNANGVFLNGRAQVIELLQMLSSAERERLLNQMKIKNPILAGELVEESVCFDDISRLNSRELIVLFQYLTPVIVGMALKGVEENSQRKILSQCPRQFAEEAFEIMMTPLENERVNIRRAQQKVIEVLIQLRRRKQIRL